MINVLDSLKNLYKNDGTHKNYFIVFRDKGVMLNNSEIVSESLSITESICSSGEFQVGLCESATCNVKVRMPDNVKGDEIFIFQTVGGYFEPTISYDDDLGIQISGDGVTRLDSVATDTNLISGLDSERFDRDSYYLIFAKIRYTGNPIYLYLENNNGNHSRMIYYLKPDMFGFKNLTEWVDGTLYDIGEYVKHNGDIWESRTNENAKEPADGVNSWNNLTHYVQIVIPIIGSEFSEYKMGVYINSDTENYGAPVDGKATIYKIDTPVMPLGLFSIDSCKKDADSVLRDIVGYDRMKDVELDTDVYISKGDQAYSQIGNLLDEAAKNTQIIIGTNLSRERVDVIDLKESDIDKDVSIDENVYEVTKHEKFALSGTYNPHPSDNDEKYTRRETTLMDAQYRGDNNGAYSCNEYQVVRGTFNDELTGFQETAFQVMKGKVIDSDDDDWNTGINEGSIIRYGTRRQIRTANARRQWINIGNLKIKITHTAERVRIVGDYTVFRLLITYHLTDIGGTEYKYVYLGGTRKWSKSIPSNITNSPYIVTDPFLSLTVGNSSCAVALPSESSRDLQSILECVSGPGAAGSGSNGDGADHLYRCPTIIYPRLEISGGSIDVKVGYYSQWNYSTPPGYVRESSLPGVPNIIKNYNGYCQISTRTTEIYKETVVQFHRDTSYGYSFNRWKSGWKTFTSSPIYFLTDSKVYSDRELNKKDNDRWRDTSNNLIYTSCYARFMNENYTYGYEWDEPDPKEVGCSDWMIAKGDDETGFGYEENNSLQFQDHETGAAQDGVIYTFATAFGTGDHYAVYGRIWKYRRKRYWRTRRWSYDIPSPQADEYGGGWTVALPDTENKTAIPGNEKRGRDYENTVYNYSLSGENGQQISQSNTRWRWRDDNTKEPYTHDEILKKTAVGGYRDSPAYERLGRIYNRELEYSYTWDLSKLPAPLNSWAFDKTQAERTSVKKDDYGQYNKSGDERLNKESLGNEAGKIYQRTDRYNIKWRDYIRDTLYYWKEKGVFKRTDYAVPESVYNPELAYSVYFAFGNDLEALTEEQITLQALIDAQTAETTSDDENYTTKGELTVNNRQKFINAINDMTTTEADVREGNYYIGTTPYKGGLFGLEWLGKIQCEEYIQYTGEEPQLLRTWDILSHNPFQECIAHSKAEKFNGEQIKWAETTGGDAIKHATRREVVNAFLAIHGMFINFDRWGVSTMRKVQASSLYPHEELFPHDSRYTEDGTNYPLLAYGDIYPSVGTSESTNTALLRSLYIEDETNNDFDGIYVAKSSVTEEEKDLYPFYYNSLHKRYGALPRGMKDTGYWEGNNYFKMTSNWFFNNFIFTERQLKQICAFILENIGQLKYYNLDAELKCLPYLEVGDNILIQTRESGYETAILRRTMKGCMAQMDNIETDFYS